MVQGTFTTPTNASAPAHTKHTLAEEAKKMSRIAARYEHQENLEVGKLGEFENKKQLCEAEVLVILREKIRINDSKGRKPNKKMQEWHEKLTNRANTRGYATLEQVYQIRNAFGVFGPFFTETEISQIIDLRPRDSQEAKALIPTLQMPGRNLDEEELYKLVDFAANIQDKIDKQKKMQEAAITEAHGNADVGEVPSPAPNAHVYSPAYTKPGPIDRGGGVPSPSSAGVFARPRDSPPLATTDASMADADDYSDLLDI